MKVTGIIMMTALNKRQDPWEACIQQASLLCDNLVIVYGQKTDKKILLDKFAPGSQIVDGISGDITFVFSESTDITISYLHWPQPEWNYSELASHLNHALDIAEREKPDWIVKLDTDYFIHEDDMAAFRRSLIDADQQRKLAVRFEKKQFFMVDRYYEKGKIPIAIKAGREIRYGRDSRQYTDLCQPLLSGHKLESDHTINGAGSVWNYDYSFKTYKVSRELLYYFDRAHALYWGKGYTGKDLAEITRDKAMTDYLALVAGRIKKCTKRAKISDHPKFVQPLIIGIKPEQFGFNLWGKINV